MSQAFVPWRQRKSGRFRGPAGLVAGLAVAIYRMAAPIVRRLPLPIFLAGVVLSVLLVWAGMGLFNVVDDIMGSPFNGTGTSSFGLPLTVAEIGAWLDQNGIRGRALWRYLLWPWQSELARDLVGLVAIIALYNLIPMYAIWWERKVAGRIQSRMGPMRVGQWHGWAQSLADGIKLMGKEDLIPERADRPMFRVAPYLAFVPAFMAFFVLPFGAYWVFRNVDVALLLILAMLGVEVVGVIVAGWASNNKWSVYGAMREACQMVSYEIPMTTVLLVPIMSAGTLSLVAVGEAQAGGWASWVAFHNPFTFIAFVTYYIASLANCKRAPFDLPESESELVAGFHTEYSGFRWALFFFAEYAAMFVVSALAVTLFLGAWYSPLPDSWRLADNALWQKAVNGLLFSGPLWFLGKCVFFLYVQMWIRWTLPRIRIDQVLYSCVQVMFPVALVALLGHAGWLAWVPPGTLLYTVCNAILALIGGLTVAAILGIAVYGYANGKRMVGYLAVKQLPGA